MVSLDLNTRLDNIRETIVRDERTFVSEERTFVRDERTFDRDKGMSRKRRPLGPLYRGGLDLIYSSATRNAPNTI